MKDRVQKICDSFQGQRFEVPPVDQISTQAGETKMDIIKAEELLNISVKQLKDYLRSINRLSDEHESQQQAVHTLEVYKWFVAKEKSIYTALNMLRQGQSSYIGYFWAPVEKEASIQSKLEDYPSTDLKRFENKHKIPPPTYFKSSDISAIPQLITDTYGVPSYQEANPSTFNIVTFPFLFGIMFGDYGHGSLVFLVGLCLVLFEPFLRGKVDSFALSLRYMVMMMGFFSMYNGLLYNEFFAITNDWFGTCYNSDF